MRTSISITVLFFAQQLLAQDMPLTQVLIEKEPWQLVGDGFRFVEGPASDKQGNIYFSDVPDSKIYKITPQGSLSLFARDTEETTGLMFGKDGKLYGCRHKERSIVAYNLDATFQVVADNVTAHDLVVTSDGGIYFSDPSHKQIGYLSPQRSIAVVAKNLHPNGITLWHDGGTLVVTERDHPYLWTFRVEKNGRLSYREKYYLPLTLTSGSHLPGSDGMTMDRDGRLYVTSTAGLQMFDPTGRQGGIIVKPQQRHLSDVAFGGPQFNMIYVTCSDKVYRRKVKPQGIPYYGFSEDLSMDSK